MEKIYRKDYVGEFYIKSRDQYGGALSENREWIPNTVPAFDHSGHAVVIGNGTSRRDLALALIANHGGSHKGKMKLTSYGCNALCRDMMPNFLVVTSEEIAKEIIETDSLTRGITLTHPEYVIAHPGKFHLIPFDKHWNAGAIATWLACFDGQKKIYLLGFDNQYVPGKNINIYAGTPGYDNETTLIDSTRWETTMYDIMSTYDDVEFVLVNPAYMPESWKYLENLRQITLRDFVYEADLGA